jgi:uncharacterized membrane protein
MLKRRREKERERRLLEERRVSLETEPEVKKSAAKERKVMRRNKETTRGIDPPSTLNRTS